MTTKINLLAVSLFLPVFISAQNVIPEPAQYRPAKGEFVLSIAENKALETNNVLPSRVVQRIAPDCTTGADEAYRLEITPDEILLVDRMNKRYVRASRSELNDILPKEARFSKLEKLLLDASLPEGKSELSGKELGIPSLEKAKVRLYDFSSKEFVMTPTEISDRYTQVPLTELLNMLTKL